ncbi:pilus assembly protein [Salinisphaera sp. RV14]|uniref:pilus assembly protein n=1 Tax=Salinisphaera sp. RV14 TaxID=3454140 RepID=UPI003F86D19C
MACNLNSSQDFGVSSHRVAAHPCAAAPIRLIATPCRAQQDTRTTWRELASRDARGMPMPHQNARPRLIELLFLIVVITLACAAQRATAASSSAINLTDQPVVTGSGLAPNILVAVDNSGSMDFETLFPTDDGVLFWDGYSRSFWSNGGYVQNSNTGYVYLFPNGYNNCYGSNCTYRDRRIYSAYLALPPIPAFGFARDPEFNKAYFNPATQYTPWVNRDPSNPSAAYYDPEIKSGTIDLTQTKESTANGEKFDFQPGMVIPAGTKYYHTTQTTSSATYYNICYNQWRGYAYYATTTEIYNRQCNYYGYTFYAQKNIPTTSQSTGFIADNSDHRVSYATSYGVAYFPATFYLKQSTPLPANFGWKTGAPKIQGQGPDGQSLYGYEIKPANFTSTAAYNAAIQNFANWFTYYRKRSLAIRGGITRAFKQIGRVRVGSCTITEAKNRLSSMYNGSSYLTMTSLPAVGDESGGVRRDFYESIYGLDFSQALGTPNRPALYYLGRELENNPNIIQSPCQRNYALLFTDGYNNGTVSRVGNVDGNYGTGNHSPIPDRYTNTMADIAMRFYKQLNPPSNIGDAAVLPLPKGCPGDESVDCEQKPHMTTFGITLGQSGYIFGNSAYAAQNKDPYANPPPWYLSSYSGNRYAPGNLPTSGPQEIDDLWHAAIDSRGALLNASSPQELAGKFTSALNQILGRGETLTNATGNSTSLTSNSVVFQTQYETTHWTGDLIAFNAKTGSTAASDRLWSAASLLTGVKGATTSDGRTIMTSLRSNSSTTGGAVSGVPFTSAGLASAGIPSLTPDAIAYLRGHRDKEQTGASNDIANGRIYRNRGDTVLGDIINSVPTYVGTPTPLRYAGTWHDQLYPNQSMPENSGQTYYNPSSSSSFVSQQASREPMVYVGANDGMLHGFDAKTGAEKLAYIPNTLLDSLAGGADPLTSPSYAHRSFVDGQTTAGPAYFNGKWHTMLVGGLRNGGNTVYGLDITDPSTFSESNAGSIVRWEFKAPGLGKTFGKPSIVRLHNGEWAAIFANGYNSDNYGASLYIVDIADGHEIAHLTTGATPVNGAQGNGLATPFPVDIDGDHVTDYVYAGDLYGNVWRFDLTSSNPGDWSVHKIFQAKASNGSIQPITTQVQVAAHPNGIGYGVMVYFGTGQDIQPLNDNQSATPNSFYGVWDPEVISYDPGTNNAPPRPDNWFVTRDQLVSQSVSTISPGNGIAGLSYRTVTDNPVTYIDNNGKIADRGWAIDLPQDSGEAVLNPASIVGDNVEFSTTVINRQTCSLTSNGYFMAVSRVNGGPAANNIFDVNGDGVVNEQDASTPRVAGVGFGSKSGSPGRGASFNDLVHGTQVIKTPLTGGGTATITLARDFLNGRRSWHEIRR